VDAAYQLVFFAKENRRQIGIAADPAPGLVDRAHVTAGAEGAFAGAAHDDGMHGRVDGPGAQRRSEAPVVIEGQRIERLRPIDYERSEAAFATEQDFLLAHAVNDREGGGR